MNCYFCRWGKRAAHNRAQIVYYIAENLEVRRQEFAGRIQDMTGKSLEDSLREVDLSINRLFHWGAYCDKYGGSVQVMLISILSFNIIPWKNILITDICIPLLSASQGSWVWALHRDTTMIPHMTPVLVGSRRQTWEWFI